MNRIFLFLALLMTGLSASAQHTHRGSCGADQVRWDYLNSDPAHAREFEKNERLLKDYMQNNPNKSVVSYTVPVVVHIVHENGPENIPNSHVFAMIDEINRDFQKLNADTATVAAAFQPIIGDMDLRFRLATRDPNGNCTNGIVRYFDPAFTSNAPTQGKAYAWDRNKYLNIWVVKELPAGVGAYAFLASQNAPTGTDGITCRYTQFSPLSVNSGTRTVTHEAGHYFNLFHTWGSQTGGVGSGQPGFPSNCNDDDQVTDTPNTIGRSGGCNTAGVSCNSLDNVQNYMDYANCPQMFTAGQVSRMQAAISTFSWRTNLVSPANLIATGTDDASYANPSCPPTAEFRVSETTQCEGGAVQYTSLAHHVTASPSTFSYDWSFPGGTPATSTSPNPVVTYNTAGVYAATLSVSIPGVSGIPNIKTNLIDVLPGSGTFIAPYTENVSDPSWPNSSDPTLVWTRTRPQGSLFGFLRSTNAYFSPPAAIYLNNFSFNGSGEFELNTPPIDMSNLSSGSAFLKFRVAYRKRATENEIVFLWASTNCGETFNLVKILNGNLLSQGQSDPNAFIPSDTTDWHFIAEDVSGFAGEPNVIFSFRFGANGGNNLWLDDVAVSDNPNPEPVLGIDMDLTDQFSLYPNPNDGRFRLDFQWDGNDEVEATIIDVVGKSVQLDLGDQLIRGWNSIDIDARELGLESGLYFLNIKSGENDFTKRLIIE